MQPKSEDTRRRIFKPKPASTDSSSGDSNTCTSNTYNHIKIPKKPKDNVPEIMNSFAKNLMATTSNINDCFPANSKLLEVLRDSPFTNSLLNANNASSSENASSTNLDSNSNQKLTNVSMDTTNLVDEPILYSPEILAPKSFINEPVLSAKNPNKRLTRRNSMQNHSISKNISIDTIPATPSSSARRRRTIVSSKITDFLTKANNTNSTATEQTIGMDMSECSVIEEEPTKVVKKTPRKTLYTTNDMEISNIKNTTPKTNNRRKTVAATPSSLLRNTLSDVNISEDDFATPPKQDAVFCKTPKPITTGKKRKVSPLIKSVLRRQAQNTPINKTKTSPDGAVKSSRNSRRETIGCPSTETIDIAAVPQKNTRRTLFTPNKLIKDNIDKAKDQCLNTSTSDLVIGTPVAKQTKLTSGIIFFHFFLSYI